MMIYSNKDDIDFEHKTDITESDLVDITKYIILLKKFIKILFNLLFILYCFKRKGSRKINVYHIYEKMSPIKSKNRTQYFMLYLKPHLLTSSNFQ